ncbi:glycoside hydrolase family 6 protein [Streptomyces sp. NBC_01242]|uniref:glycoside hydrolase family 6 protein n=1 Tax=Streptomyces sp. NBC_01242 TaxID=2903795 RepID=UPI002257465D|nr:glycoside hydrolase family 6 protein [Streptomyces sp. NBC_01242]MCX4797326.1 glycoside hydrolase family 6 protein [Streptomyces sp. NBC_01242]
MYGSCNGRSGMRRAGAGVGVGAVAGAVLLLTGCSSPSDSNGAGINGAGKDGAIGRHPKAGAPYWVNPDGNAARQVAAYTADGDGKAAGLIEKIARQPVGEWIGPERPEAEAKGFTEAAAKADRQALLVLYNIPHRDCGQFSKGGAADGDAYRTWLEGVAKGIGDRRATVILEPDALLHMVDGCTPREFHEERYDLLKGAVERLKQQPNTRVYVDAGNAGWRTPDALFRPLWRAGIGAADGFAVNVANFQTTAASTDFGKRLSAKVGDKPFVIDTSRNGNGPYHAGAPEENWCNPPGRALGETPTTDTGDARVDAYLWVKRPGESDGNCKGGPKAGDWWRAYALGLARATK